MPAAHPIEAMLPSLRSLISVCIGGLAMACSSEPSAPSRASSNEGGGAGLAVGGARSGGSAGKADGEASAGSAGTADKADAASGGAASGATGGGGVPNATGCKRGLAYGHHSVADLQALSSGVSWWYNWDFQPDQAVRGAYLQAGVEYAPMIWGANTDRAAAKAAITSDASVLLGFNEPNFGSQANLSAADAAALWPELEAIADAKRLRLVSPAVNFCGGDCQDTDPFHYLDAFFAACQGCQVDAVAMHIYVGCSPSGDNKAAYLIQHVETYKTRFSQPLWLTEFACNDAKNADEQRAFLEDAVAYLEGEPRIERYAWFSGRASNVPYVDLLGDSGKLTALGQAYVNAPRNSECMQ